MRMQFLHSRERGIRGPSRGTGDPRIGGAGPGVGVAWTALGSLGRSAGLVMGNEGGGAPKRGRGTAGGRKGARRTTLMPRR